MRGYPKHINTKADFQLLLAMPQFRDRARTDLQAIAHQKDDTLTNATELVDPQNPTGPWKTETLLNPYPLWKQKGFATRKEIQALLTAPTKHEEKL